jgi:hypothetical protein
MLILGGLKCDAIYRAGNRTKIAGHAAFGPIRIAGQNDPSPKSRWNILNMLRILNGYSRSP